jgi:hypothetical protein
MSRPLDLPGPEAFSHGTRARYVTGCRCAECRAANTRAYHERQARAKAAAAELVAAPAPRLQEWTLPNGSKGFRVYSRACPGVDGAPCPNGSHLRKDSKGGVCGRCRELLVWNGLVDAAPVRRHLRKLSRKGVGYKSVADAADVGRTALVELLSGRRRQIRKQAERRILAVTVEAIADHGIVDGAATWKLVDELIARGLRKGEIAQRLGMQRAALQLGKERVLARTAYAVARLYRVLSAPAEGRAALGVCSCSKPVVFELDGENYCGRCDQRARAERTEESA